jgi:hypothetical protein
MKEVFTIFYFNINKEIITEIGEYETYHEALADGKKNIDHVKGAESLSIEKYYKK